MKKTILTLLILFSLTGTSLAMEVIRENEIETEELTEMQEMPLIEEVLPVQKPQPTSVRQRINNFPEVIQERKQEIEKRREEIKERIENQKARTIEEIKQKRDELHERIQEMRDEKQRQRARDMAYRIEKMNEDISQRHSRHLEVIELVLDKIESRIMKSEESLKDVFLNQVDSVRVMIEEARDKLIEQKSKTYIIELESQETVREDFQRTFENLREDHRKLRQETMIPIKEEVKKIFLDLKQSLLNN